MTVEGGNVSVIGRLLEEISWEGSRVKQYREGGRGLENVLTAEVLLPLTYLPRGPFLAPVLRSAHGGIRNLHAQGTLAAGIARHLNNVGHEWTTRQRKLWTRQNVSAVLARLTFP